MRGREEGRLKGKEDSEAVAEDLREERLWESASSGPHLQVPPTPCCVVLSHIRWGWPVYPIGCRENDAAIVSFLF